MKNEQKELSTPDYESWSKVVTATRALPTRRFYFFVTQAAFVGIAVSAIYLKNVWVAAFALTLVFLHGSLTWYVHGREGELDEKVGTTKHEDQRRRLEPPRATGEVVEGG